MECNKINWSVMRRCFVDFLLYLSGQTSVNVEPRNKSDKKLARKDYLEDKGYDFHKSQYWWNIVAVKLVQGWYYSASKKIRD